MSPSSVVPSPVAVLLDQEARQWIGGHGVALRAARQG